MWNIFGRDKWVCETSILKRWGYRLFGELHVPGRIRSNHILREIRALGWGDRAIRVLDAGSGRGDLAIFLARCYPKWQITAMELSEERAAIARKAAAHVGVSNLEFRLADLERLRSDGEFDLIVSADVLEHIENDVLVLENLFRALRPNGRLIVTAPSVPQRRHLGLVHARERRIGFQPSDYGHVRQGYGTADVQDKFTRAGGCVLKSYFTFGLFGTLAFDLFFIIGDSRPNPFLFALLFPALLAFGWADLLVHNRVGSAILAIGTKPEAARLPSIASSSATGQCVGELH
jgi:SAM-dependent methyltransferase